MANYRCQVIIHTDDGLAANYSTNTLYFNADSDAVLPDIETALETLYSSWGSYFGQQVEQNGHEFKWYNMADVEPRAPVRETIWDLTSNPSGTPLPPECAITVSFQGVKVSGLPQARRRGRIFLGPLDITTVETDGRVVGTAVSSIRNAAQTFLIASDTATDWRWQVFSPTDDGFVDIDNGWVDNEFDTIRSRGRVATVRTTF